MFTPRYRLEDELEIFVRENRKCFTELSECEFFDSAACHAYNFFERNARANGAYIPPVFTLPNYRRGGPTVSGKLIESIVDTAKEKIQNPVCSTSPRNLTYLLSRYRHFANTQDGR